MPPKDSAADRLLPPLWILTLLAAGVVAWLLIELKEIVVLLIVGYCIAYVVDPWLSAMERRKIPRSVGVFLVFAVFFLLLGFLVTTAVPTLAREYQKLTTNLPSYIHSLSLKAGPFLDLAAPYLPEGLRSGDRAALVQSINETVIPALDVGTVRSVFTAIGKTLLQGYSVTLTLLNLVLLPFIVFYLAVDFRAINSSALAFFPSSRRLQVKQLAGEMNRYVSAFVRGQFAVGCILFLLYGIGLWSSGVDLWLLLAIIAGFGNLVPYLGFAVGICFSTIMALITFGTFSSVLWVWIVFAVVQALEGTVISPRILGDSVGLSPLMVILAIVAGGTIFGLLGIFLAVPGAAILKVLGNHLHSWILTKA